MTRTASTFSAFPIPYLRVTKKYKIVDVLLFLNLWHALNQASKDGFSSIGSYFKEAALKLKSI